MTGAIVVSLIAGAALAGTAVPSIAAGSAAGSVSGVVFHDFNSNGVLDAALAPGAPVDVGVGGVTVTAVDADEDVVGTAVSAADGAYSISVAGARTAQLRLVFSTIPAGFAPSFSVLPSAGTGTFSASDVQLVTSARRLPISASTHPATSPQRAQ